MLCSCQFDSQRPTRLVTAAEVPGVSFPAVRMAGAGKASLRRPGVVARVGKGTGLVTLGGVNWVMRAGEVAQSKSLFTSFRLLGCSWSRTEIGPRNVGSEMP